MSSIKNITNITTNYISRYRKYICFPIKNQGAIYIYVYFLFDKKNNELFVKGYGGWGGVKNPVHPCHIFF